MKNTQDDTATEGCAPAAGYAPRLHKAPTGKKGEQRLPVVLHRCGRTERVQLTPAFNGLLALVNDVPIVFSTGRWASDAGYPKLRWVSAHTDKLCNRGSENKP